MNTKRKVGGDIGVAAARVIKVPYQAPAAGIKMLINPAGFTY